MNQDYYASELRHQSSVAISRRGNPVGDTYQHNLFEHPVGHHHHHQPNNGNHVTNGNLNSGGNLIFDHGNHGNNQFNHQMQQDAHPTDHIGKTPAMTHHFLPHHPSSSSSSSGNEGFYPPQTAPPPQHGNQQMVPLPRNKFGIGGQIRQDIEEITEEEKERQRIKREKNRIAAAKCRNRRREQLESLEKETEQLERENKSKREIIRMLQEEKENLQRALKDHELKCKKTV